jgi:hypothetical protein
LEGLLVRRILLYLQKKNKLVGKADEFSEGKSPQAVMQTVFGDPLAYHAEFPRGKAIIDYLSGKEEEPKKSQMWLSPLPVSLQEACLFLHALLDRRSDVQDKVSEAVRKEPYISAESFLTQLDTDIFDIGKFTREAAPMVRPAELPEEPVPPPPVPQPVVATQEEEDHAPSQPTAPDDPCSNCGKHFPDVDLDPPLRDQLDALGNFPSLFRVCDQLVSQYLELIVLDADHGKWRQQVIDSILFKQLNAESKVLFSIDMKNQCAYLSKDGEASHQIYKGKPAVDGTSLKRYCEVLFGGDELPAADRMALGVAYKAAAWVSQIYDCRKESRHATNMAMVRKHLRGVLPVHATSTFRLLHSNSEFSSTRGIHTIPSQKNLGKGPKVLVRRALRSARSLPDPLENIALASSKGFTVSNRPRKHVDVPGTTLCRGLSNVPMRKGYEDGKRLERNLWVKVSTASQIMKGCVKAVEAEDQEDEDDDEDLEGKEEEEEEEEEEAEGEDAGEEPVVPLVPWAKSEAVSREMINIYQITHQVIFAAGEGEDALAGVRERIPTLAFVRNAMHAVVLRQHVVSTMMLEHADTVDDGFFFRKCLVRARSVGGETIPPNNDTTPGAAQAVDGGKDDGMKDDKEEKKTDEQEDDDASSSESSS